MRSWQSWPVGTFVVGGLLVRLSLLGSGGTHDVSFDLAWGHAANRIGFAHYYYGNYFPVQYHVFQLADWSSRTLGIGGPTALKSINLITDVGLLGVIFLLVKRLDLRRNVTWLYWLAPYTLAMDWLGYVDFQMAFFAVAGVLLVASGRTVAHLLAAGFAFGIALMTKPQALMLGVVFVGLVGLGLIWSKQRRALLRDASLLSFGPLSLFVGYTVWLTSAGRGVTVLAKTMISFGNFQRPALTANETNIWMVFAQVYRRGTEPAYTVTGPHYSSLQVLAGIGSGMLIVAAIVVVARRIDDLPLHESLIAVFAVGTLTLPMTMTRAHENHLFLGAVFGLLAGAIFSARAFSLALQLILTLQFVVLVTLYQFGDTGPRWSFMERWQAFFLHHQGYLWAAAGAITFLAFGIAYASLILAIRRSHPRGPSETLRQDHERSRAGHERPQPDPAF